MKLLAGLLMGFFSGFLIYMASYMASVALFVNDEPSSVFVFVTFFGGWALSTFFLVRGARTVSRVFSRGFLLGAAEWVAIIPAGLIFSGGLLAKNAGPSSDTAYVAGAALGAGLVSLSRAAWRSEWPLYAWSGSQWRT